MSVHLLVEKSRGLLPTYCHNIFSMSKNFLPPTSPDLCTFRFMIRSALCFMISRVQDELSPNVRPERQLGYPLIIDPLIWE
jgi:hypothetical protein